MKWRLLVARGLQVLVVNAWEWQRRSNRRPEEGGMSNQMAYLARKVQPLLVDGAAAAAGEGREDGAEAGRGDQGLARQEERGVVAGKGIVGEVGEGRRAAIEKGGLVRPVRRAVAGDRSGRPRLMRDWVLD
jgi:hypothetical protein